MLGQIVLIPTLCFPKLSNALSHSRTNIRTCHPSSMDVSFWLYFAKWLHLQNLVFLCGEREEVMHWLVVVRNVENNRLEIITPSTDLDVTTSHYDNVVHIIPFKEEPDPLRLDFGVHDLHEGCACHPKIVDSTVGKRIIKHRPAVN